METILYNILQHNGFDGITKAAERMFLDAIDKHIRALFYELAIHTQLGKHNEPTTQDVAHWLNLNNIPVSSLHKELHTVYKPLSQEFIENLEETIHKSADIPDRFKSSLDSSMISHLLGSLAVSQNRPSYVANHLPPFPASHTYLASPVYPVRPTSPRRIRELATKESRLAENALRKILDANQPQVLNSPRQAAFAKASQDLELDSKSFHIVNWESQKWNTPR
ncbi:transcription factor TFIID complex subunit 8 [Schizosaccharomyces osmophilus]|uniref:Transcription initiation factor TFIID subunit 8 n=1 Tax=Schizosaccharomyces osmophilus TaxID=2545709 RepID=A0AAE9WB59_9SCHI|nr:transcription factor TFIID complex subunit 8 [Schizosaccharomyces osmophilus]WBW73087.1 transcription factor TFIID complex subunit 8 [Schizosaccharomyces osmophilus]